MSPTTISKRTGSKAKTPASGRRGTEQVLSATKRKARHDYAKLLGVNVKNSIDLIKHVEKGLAFSAVESLQHRMKLASKEMARLLDIKYRTFVRRKEAGRLQSTESDRVLRASRLFARAKDLFEGDEAAARDWLLNPARALGGEIPLEIARTEVGAREVEKLIGRLEHGVFT
jgi:putative toxin-antitoxin system antitoxin component (TIGR02293 family)